MTLGGVVLGLFTRCWLLPGVGVPSGIAAFFGVVFFGTILAFSFYMVGVNLIGPSKASLIAAIEPVSSAFFAHFWLGIEFVVLDCVGLVLIISCIFLLAKKGLRQRRSIRVERRYCRMRAIPFPIPRATMRCFYLPSLADGDHDSLELTG